MQLHYSTDFFFFTLTAEESQTSKRRQARETRGFWEGERQG